jgi:hypothetical protein
MRIDEKAECAALEMKEAASWAAFDMASFTPASVSYPGRGAAFFMPLRRTGTVTNAAFR